MKKNYLISVALLAFFATAATAQSVLGDKFEFNGLFYRVTSLSPNQVKLVSELEPISLSDPHYTPANEPNGDVNITATVTSPHSETFDVTAIDDRAFYKCQNISSVTINEGIITVGNYAFSQCIQLTSITFPESVTDIGIHALSFCNNLTTVTLPSNLTTIEENLFVKCEALSNITIPASVTAIKKSAFSNSGLTTVTLPNGITVIDESVFANCQALTSVTIPENVTTIKQSAFSTCFNLTAITLPSALTTIDEMAFLYCSSLTELEIPEGVTTIGSKAFSNCSSVTTIKLPSTITAIYDEAFINCKNVESIECKVANPDDITLGAVGIFFQVGSNVTNGTTIYVPTGSKSLYENADQWKNFNIEEETVSTHPISKSQIRLKVTGNTLALTNLPANQMVKIFSLTGELVQQINTNSNNTQQIDLPQGVYIVQIGQYTDKVIIK